MDRVYFPRVSNCSSCCPVSTLYTWIFPAFEPEMIFCPSGENATVQHSIGPFSIVRIFCPVKTSHTWMLESKELETSPEKINHANNYNVVLVDLISQI